MAKRNTTTQNGNNSNRNKKNMEIMSKNHCPKAVRP